MRFMRGNISEIRVLCFRSSVSFFGLTYVYLLMINVKRILVVSSRCCTFWLGDCKLEVVRSRNCITIFVRRRCLDLKSLAWSVSEASCRW